MSPSYRSLAGPSRFEPERIQNSRFVADVGPARDEAEARAFVEAVRAELADARHHCFAWRLGPTGEETRSSDDGEPSGSAGRPILLQVEGHDLTDTVVVVTRWFGGVKLGVGGLMRAYGGAAGMALDRAEVVEHEITRPMVLRYPYDLTGAVDGVLHGAGLTAGASDYGAEVTLHLDVPEDRVEEVGRLLRDRTADRARWEPAEPGPRGS